MHGHLWAPWELRKTVCEKLLICQYVEGHNPISPILHRYLKTGTHMQTKGLRMVQTVHTTRVVN